jgi:hypothetical protein
MYSWRRCSEVVKADEMIVQRVEEVAEKEVGKYCASRNGVGYLKRGNDANLWTR